ncbi:hypothetical protein [Streptomyces sp. P3]|uniref:hypothetical protein n=1 Tax=Streptomyces sp. P3 TaxID=2135430 RepID=UPI00131F10D0|nr:hypothetical protein [Streptomyces sp. P3]
MCRLCERAERLNTARADENATLTADPVPTESNTWQAAEWLWSEGGQQLTLGGAADQRTGLRRYRSVI